MSTFSASLDSASLKKDFPLLERRVDGNKLIYLDSAATSLKPRPVIDAVVDFYENCTANVHRSAHRLSEEATEKFELARESVARFINADSREIAFTRNATEALNIVARATADDQIVATTLSEHHSNLLPWQRHNPVFLPLDADNRIDLDQAETLISRHKPHLTSIASVSNVLGVRQPIEDLVALAQTHNSKIMIDLSQSVGHEPVDVFELGCDYACFSAHKMLGPSGVGVLYQREGQSDPIMHNYLGGEMVHQAHKLDFEPRPYPWGLEAGTPNIEGVIGLGAAVEYIDSIGIESIQQHVSALAARLREAMTSRTPVRLLSSAEAAKDTGIVTFHYLDLEAQGLAKILSNRFNIMIRSGFHCAQPFHEAYNLAESNRASLHFYNTQEDIDAFLEALDLISQTLT